MTLPCKPLALATVLSLGLASLPSSIVLPSLLAQAPGDSSGLPAMSSTGRSFVGGPSYTRPSQLPPGWERYLNDPRFDWSGFFGGGHLGGLHFPRQPHLAPIRPGTVGPPTTAPGTPGPGVIR